MTDRSLSDALRRWEHAFPGDWCPSCGNGRLYETDNPVGLKCEKCGASVEFLDRRAAMSTSGEGPK